MKNTILSVLNCQVGNSIYNFVLQPQAIRQTRQIDLPTFFTNFTNTGFENGYVGRKDKSLI